MDGNRAFYILVISNSSQFVPILVYRTLGEFQFCQAVPTFKFLNEIDLEVNYLEFLSFCTIYIEILEMK